MAQGRTSPRAEALAAELRSSIQDFEPRTEAEQALQSEGLTLSRRTGREPNAPPVQGSRWLSSHPVGGPGGGGVITVVFTYLIGMETPWLHMLAGAALTVLVTHILYTDSVLEYPFNDAARVGPDAFELVLRQIEGNSN